MTPAVSIVLPAYNHAAFVREAVQSVLDQTFRDFEIIAIDDCSSDQTAQILEGIDDPRLTVIRHQTNHGAARTINEGVYLARAPFIAVLNSDDVFRPERLELCMRTTRETGCMLLGTGLELIDEQSRVNDQRDFWWNEWHLGLNELFRNSEDLAATLISGNIFVSTSNFFFDRRIFEIVGPLSDYRYVQDYEFLLRCLALIPGQVTWINDVLLQYRLHASNTIMEDPVAPVFQTIEILARWAPQLISEANAPLRQARFEEHLLRLAGYVERGTVKKNEDIRRAEVGKLQACIDGLKVYVENLQQHVTGLQKHCDGLQRHCDSLQAENESLQRRWSELQHENESLQSHCDKLQAHCDELEKYGDELLARNGELQRHCDNLQAYSEKLQRYCDGLQVNHDSLKQHADNLATRNEELQAHCDGLQTHCDELEKYGNELLARNGELQRHCDNLQAYSEKLQRYCDGLQVSHDSLKQYADNLATRNEELQAHCDGLQTHCDNLQIHCESLQGVCDSQANSLETLQDLVDSAHQNNKKLASQLDAAWSRCAELETALNDAGRCLQRIRESRGYRIYCSVVGAVRYLIRSR